MKHIWCILTVGLLATACGEKPATETEKKEVEQVEQKVKTDQERADSFLKAQQQKMDDATLDTSVKMVEPAH